MAQQAVSAVTALLKEVYEDRLVSQLQDEAIGYKRLEKTSDGVTSKVGGKFVDFPIVVQRNQGISYRAEGEQLGNPGRSGYAEVNVGLKYGYGRLQVTGQLIELADGNPKSFANALDKEMSLLKDAIGKDQSRIFYGDATGYISGLTANAAASATLAVEDTYWFEVGMEVDVRAIAGGAAVASGTGVSISAIDSAAKTITISAAITATAGTHAIYRAGNFASGTAREPEGLKSIVKNTGVLYGVDPATVDKWRSVVTAVNGSINESQMVRMVDDIRVNGGSTSLILTTLGVRRAYNTLLQQQRTFVSTKMFEGGLAGLAFTYGGKEIALVEDPDLRPDYAAGVYTGRMYFLSEKEFKFYHTHDWKWQDRDGNVLKWITNFDAYEAFTQRYWQLGVSRRNAQGVLTGITEG